MIEGSPATSTLLSDVTLISERAAEDTPFLTIAIPQYNRRRYLEVNLASLFEQALPDFEILVSDDGSSDDSNQVIPGLLEQSGRPYQYFAQKKNLGYDRNVRFCLRAARGMYVMMVGNDDAIVGPHTLDQVVEALKRLDLPEVAITNYEDWETGQVTLRAYSTRILGAGPSAAINHFRAFSFTSGLIYKSSEAEKYETDRWDMSIYYQIYLACRIIASGGRMAGLNIRTIRDHIRLDGELVPETYRRRYQDAGWTFAPKHTGLDSVARVTVDAVIPYVVLHNRSRTIEKIWRQLLFITYPYWVLEYRRLANWSWGVAVARDLWPGRRLAEYDLRRLHRLRLWLLYCIVTCAALTVPPGLFTSVRHKLAETLRRRRQE